MTGAELIQVLRSQGATFRWIDGVGKVRGSRKVLTPNLQAEIDARRPEIRAALKQQYQEAYDVLCRTTAAIALVWVPGTLAAVQDGRPDLWAAIRAAEDAADAAVLGCDSDEAAIACKRYREAWDAAVEWYRGEVNAGARDSRPEAEP